MKNIKIHKISLRKVMSFLALTALFTGLLNLPTIFLSDTAKAATATQYSITTMTNTEVGVSSKNFKVMEFVIPDSNTTGGQDKLLLDGSQVTENGDSLIAFPPEIMFVDQGGGAGFQSGDDIVQDLDDDGVFTSDMDYLVDGDGATGATTEGPGSVSVLLNAGDSLYDIGTTDYIRANSVNRSSVTQVWHDKDQDGRYTSDADQLVDADGSVSSSIGVETNGIGAGSALHAFAVSDDLFYAVSGTQTSIEEISDIDGLWLDDGDGKYNGSRYAEVSGLELFSDMTIDNTNKDIVINVSGGTTGDEVLSVATGSYTGATLATAVDVALESATDLSGADDVNVSYSSTTGKFTITNNFVSDFDLAWDASSSTIEEEIGFDDSSTDTVTSEVIAVPATGSLTVTGGDNGDSYTVTIGASVGSEIAFDTNDEVTALAIATDITNNIAGYSATAVATSVVSITADSAGVVGNNEITVAVLDGGGIAPSTTDTDMTGGVDAVGAGTTTSDNAVNAIILDDTNNILELTYSFNDGLNGISTTTDGIVVTSDTYNDITTLKDAINTAITANTSFSLTDFEATAVVNHVVFTTTETGYGVEIDVTGGNAKNILGFTTTTPLDGLDSLIYGDGMTIGSSGLVVVNQTGGSLRYRDEVGSDSGYNDGEYIYIDEGGYTHSPTADDLLLDVNGTITTTTTGYDVSDTAGWVMEKATYTLGDDIFIENYANELTYSDSADTIIINGSFQAVSAGDTLETFDVNDKFVDSVPNGSFDSTEDVYQEDGATGGQVDYESFNAITVSNAEITNPIAVEDVTSMKLYYEENSSATFSGGDNPTEDYIELSSAVVGTYWRSIGNNIQIPDTNGLKLYITIDTDSDVVEGQKMQAKISQLVDGDSDGAYDDGDRGIFVSTSDDGPDDTALTSTVVSVSAFGTLLDDLEDEIKDFEKEIKNVMLYSSDDDYDDYTDDIDSSLNELNDLLADPIDSASDLSNVFDEFDVIINKMDSLVGLIPTSEDDGITSREHEDVTNELNDVKDIMGDLVVTVGNVIETDLDDDFGDEEDEYDDNWRDLKESLRDKNPDADNLKGTIDYLEDMIADLDDILEDDIDDITDDDSLADVFDDILDNINLAIDELNSLDETTEYDKDDLDDLAETIDDLRNKAEALISDIESRISEIDTAAGNTDMLDEYEDEDYESDTDDTLDELDDAFDELDRSGTVNSPDVEDALDDLDEIVNNLEDMGKDDVDDVLDDHDTREFMADLVDEISDAKKIVEDILCTISEDDYDDVENSVDDIYDAAKDTMRALKKSLEDRSLFSGDIEEEYDDGDKDYDDAKDELDEALEDIEKLEGRCEDVDTAGPYSLVSVASNTELIIDSTGTDTTVVTSTAQDNGGRLLSDTIVNFEITSPSNDQGTLDVSFDRTENGVATVEYTPGEKTSGLVTIKAYSATNTDVSDTVTIDVYNGLTTSTDDDDTDLDSDDDDDQGSDDDSVTSETVAKSITSVTSDLDPETGGEFVLQVADENGNPVADTAVTLSMMDEQGNISSYYATTNSSGEAHVVVPASNVDSGSPYTVLATTGNGSASTGQMTVMSSGDASDDSASSDSQTQEGSTGDPDDSGAAVLGDSDDASAGNSDSASSLPTTGALPLATFVLSSFGSYILIFKEKK